MAVKALAPNIDKASRHIIEKAGDVGRLYRADVHRSVVTRVIMDALINEGHIDEKDRSDASLIVYGAMAQESTLLEHSNFKQSRLAANGLVDKAPEKQPGQGLII